MKNLIKAATVATMVLCSSVVNAETFEIGDIVESKVEGAIYLCESQADIILVSLKYLETESNAAFFSNKNCKFHNVEGENKYFVVAEKIVDDTVLGVFVSDYSIKYTFPTIVEKSDI